MPNDRGRAEPEILATTPRMEKIPAPTMPPIPILRAATTPIFALPCPQPPDRYGASFAPAAGHRLAVMMEGGCSVGVGAITVSKHLGRTKPTSGIAWMVAILGDRATKSARTDTGIQDL